MAMESSEEPSKSWTINYVPIEGGRFTGELHVEPNALRFETLYESSNKTIVKAIFVDVASFAAAGGHTIYRYSNDNTATIALPTAEIAAVNAAKKGLGKRAVVTMKNGEVFTFDYGMLSVKKLVAAIESVRSAAEVPS